MFSHVQVLVTPQTVAHQSPLSMGILQARILEWVAMSSSRESSQPRDQTQVSRIAGKFFTIWVIRKAIRSHNFMVNRWRNNGKSDRLYFLRLQIIVDGDCSHEIKRHLLLGRKAMTNLESILKSREITFVNKDLCNQSYGFPSTHV